MADTTQPHSDTDTKTRANLAYLWSIVAALILGYIVIKWGDQKEILTLIIGLIGGTVLGGIFGIYFGGSITSKKQDIAPIQQADNVNVNTPTDEK